ncbi:hypothetical protein [Scopulibacillus cellulosilyticus]|uniref:Uncharacterized protein n=1 Tax=Scopulibacillus cellulosilyticus TaxID=2665665 RepID=A0ABW2Q088_9BACL
MLFFVIWVIVVIIALALLMTYNIIAFRKNDSKPDNKGRQAAEERVSAEHRDVPSNYSEAASNNIQEEEKMFDETIKEEKSETFNDAPAFAAEEQRNFENIPRNDNSNQQNKNNRSGDKDYREALRELMSGQTSPEEKIEEEKGSSSDSDYREALRSLSKKQ